MAAISAAIPTNGTGNSASASTVATGSVTRVSNRLYIAYVFSRKSGGGTLPTISGFTQLDTAVNGNLRVTAFRYLNASPPGAGAITADFGGATQAKAFIVIVEFQNVSLQGTNGSGAVPQTFSDAATGSPIAPSGGTGGGSAYKTFHDAFLSDSATALGLGHLAIDSTTPGVGLTELDDEAGGSTSIEVAWKLGAPALVGAGGNILGDFTSGSADWALVALEIKSSTSTVAIGLPTETDVALSISPHKHNFVQIGIVSEADVANHCTTRKAVRMGVASEAEVAVKMNAIKVFRIGSVALTQNAPTSLPIYPIE